MLTNLTPITYRRGVVNVRPFAGLHVNIWATWICVIVVATLPVRTVACSGLGQGYVHVTSTIYSLERLRLEHCYCGWGLCIVSKLRQITYGFDHSQLH